jgi:hypothetical protein
MEVTKWLKPSISVSRIGDSASVQTATRVNAKQADRGKTRHKHGPKTAYQSKRSVALQSTVPAKRTRKRKGDPSAAPPARALPKSGKGAPL